MIDAAFEAEVRHGANDAGRRSVLLFYSSVVSARYARWNDALRDMDEALVLTTKMAPDSSFVPMKMMKMEASRRGLLWAVKRTSKLDLVPCSGCSMAKAIRSCLKCLKVSI